MQLHVYNYFNQDLFRSYIIIIYNYGMWIADHAVFEATHPRLVAHSILASVGFYNSVSIDKEMQIV